MVARVTVKHVFLATLPHQRRRLLRLHGADVTRFLQGVLSADLHQIRPGQAEPAALLTVKGKLISEVVVLAAETGRLAIAVPEDVADTVYALLDRHIIMDDVVVESASDVEFAVVWPGLGPLTGAAVEVYATQHPAPGLLVVGPAPAVAELLVDSQEATPADWYCHRIAAAAPGWGHEIVVDAFPPEVGFTAAVSYDKGCFMGQEPLARIHARGQVNRVMVRVAATQLPVDGPVTLATPERPAAGRWTTWARDGEHVLGLAVVHRSLAVPGTVLHTAASGPVTVTSGPLGDDPGVAGKARSATASLGKRAT